MTTTASENDYSTTVNLPDTAFPQKAGLATSEPLREKKWNEARIWEQLSARTELPNYILHDGPPYANGDIHIGHTLNKVLKDIIVKYKAMTGHRARYVPGWDCHGLPIEAKVVEKLRAEKTFASKSLLEIRQLCAAYANEWIDVQRNQFKRLGVGGDWEHPYITMDPKFEVAILDALRVMVAKGLVYKGLKVVHWDPVYETALAEAEIEYNDQHVSPSIYVRFPFKSKPAIPALQGPNTSIVIWTTTPWTLPANLGISLHPDFDYVAYKTGNEVVVVAKGLLDSFLADSGLPQGEILAEFKGTELDRQVTEHPLIAGKDSLVMLGDHVTMEQGTGAVHTAPGHGVEDFHIGKEYGLPVFNPVDEKGCYTDQYPDMVGVNVFKANPMVVEKLKDSGRLVSHKPYTHKYPYSWRSHKPVIMRATEQWFMTIDPVRDAALAECDKVEWIPRWGYDRIFNMLKTRPDWCLSRQRSWGVPIPSIRDTKTGESLLLPEVISNLQKIVATEGTDAWFARSVEDFLPEDRKGQGNRYEKEFNCLDVWFDSGSTHHAVLTKEYGLTWPADLYLEGADQHRGWFQSSMWVGLGVYGRAPYKAVLTHGFVLDELGRPMSKSLGNVISPLDVIKDSGADVLRMWVSSEDYRSDVKISKNSLAQISNAYRRIRNTLRYLLSNLYDFDPARDSVAYSALSEEDRWVLRELGLMAGRVRAAYDEFEFHRIYQEVNNFCVTQLGALYLDMMKDRLYCSAPGDPVRRGTQTTQHHIASAMARLLAPIVPFTADEAWEHLPGTKGGCVHLEQMPVIPAEWTADAALGAKWQRLLTLRSEVTQRIEPLRAKEAKVIGNSLDAKVTLSSRDAETTAFLKSNAGLLETVFIVSQVVVQEGSVGAETAPELAAAGLHASVEVGKADGVKCPRCRRWSLDVGKDPEFPDLDPRCADAMRRIAPK